MSEREEALKLGEALAALRRDRGLSQAEAGTRIGMTSQGWGFYESGKRAGLFRPDVQRKLTSALDATPEDLMLLVGQESNEVLAGVSLQDHRGVEARGRAFESRTPAKRSSWLLADNDMQPWANAGVTLEYQPEQWPREGQGCVIDFVDGRRIARIFCRADHARLWVRYGVGKEYPLARLDIRLLSAVTARLEP